MKQINNMWLPLGDTFFVHKPNYESADYELVKQYITRSRCAVDVGAHVGYWSRRLVNDFERVYAFEANPVHVQCLLRNVHADVDQFTVHDVALSDHVGTVQFETHTENSGMSRVAESGETIECAPLDNWKLQPVDLIKIDVEGHELQVLQGAAHTILRNRPVLFIEILNSTPAETRNAILDLLAQWNYRQMNRIAENYIFVSAS